MRSVNLWVGRTDDERPPPRVYARVFERDGGRCHCCGRKIAAGERWELDHVVALINGGLNVESNLAPIINSHHVLKTADDVAEKSRTALVRAAHLGIRKSSKPLPCGRDSPTSKTMQHGVVPRRTQVEKHRDMMEARYGE
jgi:hypothetical protein